MARVTQRDAKQTANDHLAESAEDPEQHGKDFAQVTLRDQIDSLNTDRPQERRFQQGPRLRTKRGQPEGLVGIRISECLVPNQGD